MAISEWAPTCDSTHSWQTYSAIALGNHTADTMTQYITQSHYPNTDLISSFPILIN